MEFKIGDKVVSKSRRYMGAAKIIDETDDEYIVKFDSGARDMLDKDDVVAANSRVRSTNAVVANALNACARNADFGDLSRKVKVLSETETLFGKRRETKVMTLGELRDSMAKCGHSRNFADILRDMEAGREANPYITLPCEAWFSWA